VAEFRGGSVIAAGTQAFWFLTRGTGVVSLLLLTTVVVLGISGAVGWKSKRWPRFVTQGLHRNLSLLAVAFVGVHIAASVVDAFSPIRWLDAVLPFGSAYRPVWLGLGAVAFDLLIALVLTSLVRVRLGYGSWRAVHWLAYACWPVSVVHGLGTGSDTRELWMLAIDAIAVGAVIGAVAWRVGRLRPVRLMPRLAAVGASVLGTAGVVLWLVAGPLQPGWASTAGTPDSLLNGGKTSSATVDVAPLAFPSRADLTATTQVSQSGEIVTLDIRGTLSGSTPIDIEIGLRGESAGSSLAVADGAIRLGPPEDPTRYQGRVTIDNGTIVAQLSDGAGSRVEVSIVLQIDQRPNATTGTVRFSTSGGTS
jgi:DMSO/TMAO reductase YedYZ heme-binding membrane subunit